MILEPIHSFLARDEVEERSHDAVVQHGALRGLGSSTIEHALKCTDDICQIGNDRVKIDKHLRG